MTAQNDGTFHWGQLVPLAERLERELDKASPAYARFEALRWVAKDAIESDSLRYWQVLRITIIDVLRDHLKSASGDGRAIPLPSDIAEFLIECFLDLADGDQHPLFVSKKFPLGKGNLRRRRVRIFIDRAVDYITASDIGLVDDSHSRTTVAQSFGVNRRQVSRWLAASGNLSERKQKIYIERRNMFRHQEKHATPATEKFFTFLMERAAEGYKNSRRR